MPILNIKHWFQKRESALSAVEVAREQMSRFNALLKSDPKDLTNAITCFDSGYLAPLARLIEEYERRDDKMKTCSMKMKASVGRCDYSIQLKEGFESDPRADRHAEILKRFWSTVRTTSTFNRNETGGFNLLKKQMMDAQSYGYAVHELVWKPTPGGELRCEFIQVPLWHFENRTGSLRFLPTTTSYDGLDMKPGEWMVTTGDGVGIAAALCACMKRMGLVDWMIYNERCGMPLLHGSTGAAYGSDQWNNLNKAIKNIARYTQILTDSSTKVEAIPLGGGASIPYPQLIEWCDRAIAALYRGADLSTISQGQGGVGASLQGDESDMLEQDACARLSDTLNESVDRFVIRYVTGDDEPLARLVVEPVSKPNVDTDIKIDQHLVSMGVRLSKNDALQRYGRSEADPTDPEDAALEQKQQPAMPGVGFANEKTDKGSAASAPSDASAILADIAATILDGSIPFEDALNEAQSKLESIDPALLAGDLEKQLEDAMFEAAAKATNRPPNSKISERAASAAPSQGAGTPPLANEVQRVPGGNGNGGQFTGKTNQPDGQSPRNDGKIDFKGNLKAKAKANDQALKLGYSGIDDLMSRSASVSKEKIDSVLVGGGFTCEAHEAVAALRTLSTIKSNVKGGEVKLTERALRHYVCGERRHHGGEPEVGRLCDLPKAIDAVKHSDSRHWELDGKRVVVMPGEKPAKGTQAVYCKNIGKSKTYAYADSGVLNGWQVN